MSYCQHFGLKHDPLGKNTRNVVPSEQAATLTQHLNWLLQTKGVGLITGDAGTGKTTALREWSAHLNPMAYQVFYQSDNHFKPFDIYSQLGELLGLEKHARYSTLWRALKRELINLVDNKQVSPIWIIDEAHLAPTNFLAELPAFLNFSFDSREVLTIILVGLPTLQSTLKKSYYGALHSRILFQYQWNAIDEPAVFNLFIMEAFKNAGMVNNVFSQSGLQLIYMASKGKLRYAHRILTQAFQLAAKNNINHLPDDILQLAIDNLV